MKKNSFSVGDRVEAIDDVISGTVIFIKNDKVIIETDEGFEMEFSPTNLICKESTENLMNNVTNYSVAESKASKETTKRRQQTSSRKDKTSPIREVDLHIEQLLANTRGMDNYDILSFQLSMAKRVLAEAQATNTKRLVFIHGEGEGKLKLELEFLLRRYSNLRFYPASFQKYGMEGATEVEFIN